MSISNDKLVGLGFLNREIEIVTDLRARDIPVTSQRLANMGFNPVQCKRLKYLKDILDGAVDVDSKEGLIKHLKKINPTARRLRIEDFAVSKVDKVPRYAIVGGIKDPCYSVINSKNYKEAKDKYYHVRAVNSRITISTDKKIVLKNGYAKKLEGQLELLGKEKGTGRILFAMDRKCCKLCNRYVIMASLRRPEFHLGLYEIITRDGTLVYVYARDIGVKPNLNYQGGNSRVYDYGYKKEDIASKLNTVSKWLYRGLKGVKVYKVGANAEFREIESDYKKDVEIEE